MGPGMLTTPDATPTMSLIDRVEVHEFTFLARNLHLAGGGAHASITYRKGASI